MHILSWVVQWLLVPIIMLGLFIFAVQISAGASRRDAETRVSSWAGFWAGLVVFVTFVVSQLSSLAEPDFATIVFRRFEVIPILIGFACGFGIMLVAKFIVPSRLVGLMTLILIATTTSALFSYFFIQEFRILVVYASLSFAFGVIFYVVLWPRTFIDLLGQ